MRPLRRDDTDDPTPVGATRKPTRRADVARRRREPHAPGAADGEYNTVLDVLDGDAETSDDTVLERPFGEHLLEKWRRVLGNGLVDPPGRGALDEPRRDLSASSEL